MSKYSRADWVWFGWLINQCRSFNAKSCPVYTYILNIYDLKTHLVDIILK